MQISFFGIVAAALLLTGCGGHIHPMVKEGETPFTQGEFIHEQGAGNSLVLEMSGQRYESRGFAVRKQTNLAELRKRYYGVNPKHWNRISYGLDSEHSTYSIETVARSAEGDELSCELAWKSGTSPEGTCSDNAGALFSARFR